MKVLIGFMVALFFLYTVVGTYENVDEIKKIAPADMDKRGWEILSYEGFQFGKYMTHGGVAWYHVKDTRQENVYYRVRVAMWGGELQYIYGEPEKLSRVDLSVDYD